MAFRLAVGPLPYAHPQQLRRHPCQPSPSSFSLISGVCVGGGMVGRTWRDCLMMLYSATTATYIGGSVRGHGPPGCEGPGASCCTAHRGWCLLPQWDECKQLRILNLGPPGWWRPPSDLQNWLWLHVSAWGWGSCPSWSVEASRSLPQGSGV